MKIPPILAKALQNKPLVQQWMVVKLGATDMHTGAPSIRQKHPNPVTAVTTIANHLQGVFNSPASFPDVTVLVEGQEILVHKLFISIACKVLAAQWREAWDQSKIVTLDCECHSCQISEASYRTALMFLEFFYCGKVTWPDGLADSMTAAELLLLSDKYDVPYLFCEAEKALKSFVTRTTCFDILILADHHNAEQLSNFCVAYIAHAPPDQIDQERLSRLPHGTKKRLKNAGCKGKALTSSTTAASTFKRHKCFVC